MMARQPRRKVGRPPKPMPDPIPDTPENVALALMSSPPREPDEWEYLRPKPSPTPASADELDASS